MKHFANANITLKGSNVFEHLRSKFINVNDKAIAFVSKQLIQPTINKDMID